MKKEIIMLCNNNQIDLVGFTNLECEYILKDKYELQQKLNYKTTFQIGDITDKILTGEKYKKYNSAIVIGISYPKIDINEIHVSSCSFGTDYHIVLKEKLNIIKKYLSDLKYTCEIFVDNNSLDERYLAYKSGLGFFGKNNMLINEKIGSFFFIGVLLTDAIFEYDTPIKKQCLNCNKCIDSCPNGAINENGILNANKCLSYITQKKNITKEEEKLMNNCIYGCDICNNVCPYNKDIVSNNFKPLNNEIIDEKHFLNMSKEQYKRIYSNNSCYWRGKDILDRNIKCYLKNNELNK